MKKGFRSISACAAAVVFCALLVPAATNEALAAKKHNNSSSSSANKTAQSPTSSITPPSAAAIAALKTAGTSSSAASIQGGYLNQILQYVYLMTTTESNLIQGQLSLINSENALIATDTSNVETAVNTIQLANASITSAVNQTATNTESISRNADSIRQLNTAIQTTNSDLNTDINIFTSDLSSDVNLLGGEITNNANAISANTNAISTDYNYIAANRNYIIANQGELATQEAQITQSQGELAAQGTEIAQNQALDQSQIAQNQAELNEAAMAEGINFQSIMASTSNPFVNQNEAHSIATALGNLDLAEKGKLAAIKPNAATLAATNKKLVMLSSGMFGNGIQAQANAFARLSTTGDQLNTRFEQLKTMITLVKVLHDSGQVTQAGVAHLQHFINENAKELNLPTINTDNVSQLSLEAKSAIAGVMKIKDKNIAFTVANLSNAMMKTYVALLTSVGTHADPNITVSLYNLMVSEHHLLVKLNNRLLNTLTPEQKARITKYMLDQQQLDQYHQVLAQPLTARASMLDEEHAKAQRKLIIEKVKDAQTVSDITGQDDDL